MMIMDLDNFKDPVERWVKITDALWDLVAHDPYVAPAFFSWTIAKQGEYTSGPGRKSTVKHGSRLGREFERFRQRFVGTRSRWPEEKCDVLFVPNSSRSNYLGACISAAEALFKDSPWIKAGFIIPADLNPDIIDTYPKPFSFYKLTKSYAFSLPLLLKGFQLLRQIRNRSRQDGQLNRWFAEEGALKRWRAITSSIFAVHFARKWLKKAGCSLIITPNEQWIPGSTLVAAARLEEIYTCQILHGMPARYYWPFLSDEMWLWGPRTSRMFREYGAPGNQLKTMGSLEFAGIPPHRKETDKGTKTCLFLSQWHGREHLGEAAYVEILKWIGIVISELDEGWQLVIRWHPHDGEDGLEFHKGLFSGYGVNVNFSERGISLEEDVMGADFVCTQSSTAILMPLKLRVPCALLWAQEHFRNLGEPFLGPPFLATSISELRKALSVESQEEDYRKSVHDLLGDPELTEMHVSGRITEILSCRRP